MEHAMRSNMLRLLSSTAFANIGYRATNNTNSPAAAPLIAAAHEASAESMVRDGDELLKRAPDMAAMVPYWDKTDAIVEGYEAVKNGGATFLPRWADEKDDEYQNRLNLTKFTNIYRDVVEGLTSKPFEQEITLNESEDSSKAPDEIVDFCEDVDGTGNNITVFAAATMFNGINSAIDWIFVDHPIANKEVIRTREDEKKAGIRPFWSRVLGRNMLEVRTTLVNGKQQLSYCRIFEPAQNETPDCVRIFEHDGGVVKWELWEKMEMTAGGKAQFRLISSGNLSIDVIPLVPFITGRRDGSTWKIFPAMRDAADLQIELYQQESGLKFVKTMSAYPMLAGNGIRPQFEADNKTPKKLGIGPARVLYGIPASDGQAGEWKWIEPSAQNMKFLKDDIDATKQDLRELGRQPLTAQSGNLTTITTAVAAGKARSAVIAWSLNLKDALENALVITAKFLNLTSYEPEINVYTDFDDVLDTGADLETLYKSRESRDISHETYISELKRRKVLAPEVTFDIEMERIKNEIPSDDDLDLENPEDNNNRNPAV